jgi:ADP-ribose pyrophosphatase
MKTPKLISRKNVFKGSFFNVYFDKVKLPNGKTVCWNAIDWNGDAVSIIAVDNKKNVYFSKEWRNAWKKKITIIPAGAVKKNASERENLEQARNELREEIGFDAKKFVKLLTVLNSARMRNRVHMYLATGLYKSPKKPDDDEIIEVVKIPFKKAYKMFLSGKEETTGYTILSLILAKEKLKMKI